MKSNLRKKNLIRPALQLKITLVFMATSAALMALMGYLSVWLLTDDSKGMPGENEKLVGEVMPVLLDAFLISMALLVPVTLVVGVLATFLIAGPIYRFEQFMRSTLANDQPEDCKLRKGDELHEFCELLNEVTRPLRSGDQEATTSDDQTSRAA